MREFFKGRRRKFGAMSLALACVFAAGWVRSFIRGDSGSYRSGAVTSHHGGLFCEVAPSPFIDFGVAYFSSDAKSMRNRYSDPMMVDLWHWRRLGYAYGIDVSEFKNADGTTSQITIYYFYIPYSSIVIPLTLLSTWLLLAQPRPAKKAELPKTEIVADGIDRSPHDK